MKLVFFCIFCLCMQVSAKVFSQDAKIDLDLDNVTLAKALHLISRKTDYHFLYNNDLLPAKMKVSLTVKQKTVPEIMQEMLSPTGLSFQVSGTHLIAIGYNNQAVGRITGTVTDSSGSPLPGVTIQIKGTNSGTVTDGQGHFAISAADDAVLMVSFIGYRTEEVAVDGESKLKIVLHVSHSGLNEVVVVGYGTQKKVDLTGAVATVSGKELVNKPVPNTLGALQGLLPGVTVTRSSGQPGEEGYGIRIRGFSSVNQPDPLVLIDGMEGDISLVNPDDIASISVLKDAAAAAIYGSRAAGGVILVTTKKGTDNGATHINLSAYYGVDITARQPQRLNSWDEETLINEARLNATGKSEFSPEQIQWLENPNFNYRPNISGQKRWDYYSNNNWIQEGMNKYNPSQSYSLSVTSGTKKLNYILSGGFYSRRGVLKYGPDGNKRYNLRLNVNSELNRYVDLTVRASYAGSFVSTNSYGASGIAETLYRVRTRQPVYVPKEDTTGQLYNGDLQVNPIDIEKNAGREDDNYEIVNGQADLLIHDVVKGLTVNLIATRAQSYYNATTVKRSLYWYGSALNTLRYDVNVPNALSKTKNRQYDNNLNAYATYRLDVATNHHFSIMGGWQFEDNRLDEETATATGMITNDFYSFNYADVTTKGNSDKIQTWALGSYFGRFNYDYKDKYLFEANIRYDGSSKLAPGRRWGAFPSFSAGWNIFREPFMQKLSFLSNLKLRASWGELGNGSVLGNYDYIALLSTGTNLDFNDQMTQYIYQKQLASPNKTWEIVQTSDVGVDASFLNGRLNVTGDYYIKYNKNMLATVQLPNIVGVSAGTANVGELKTWGWEFDAQWRDRFTNGSYSIGVNISNDKNKLIKYNGVNSIGTGGSVHLLEGYSLNTIWGYRTAGYYASRKDYESTGIQSFNNANVSGGDVRYLDLDGNKVISAGGGTPEDPGDLVYLGTSNGHYLFGLNLGVNWKGFDFSVFFQGVGQRKFLIDAGTMNPLDQSYNMPWSIMMDRWTVDDPNPKALFPREYQGSNFNYEPSDKWVQNGAYIRLKNLQLGYTVPLHLKSIQKLRVYFSGEDLWEATKVLSVFDPEVPDGVTAYAYPFYRVVAFGANFSF